MSIFTRLQAIILGVLVWAAALFFAPWFYTDSFEYPKAIFFIIATGVLTIITLAQRISDESSFSFRRLPIELKLFGVMVLAELIAFIFSTDRSLSLSGAPYRFQGLIAQLTIAVYFLNVVYIFQHFPSSVSFRRIFFGWLVGSAVVTSAVSLLPFFVDTPFLDIAAFRYRAYGTFGNPNYLAVFLIGLIPIFSFFFNSTSRFVRLISFAGLGVTLVTLFLTGCRSAWIGSILGFLIIALLVARKRKLYRMVIITGFVIVLSVGIFVFQKFTETQLFHRLSLTEDNVGSVTTRVYLQKAGLQLFLERPILGTGQEAIAGRIEPYLPAYLKSNDIFYIDRTHNEFLDVLVMQGIVGFFAYMAFWIVLLWNAIRHYLSVKYKKSEMDHEKIFLFSIASIFSILAYYGMNFSTISGNILLYFFAGCLLAAKRIVSRK